MTFIYIAARLLTGPEAFPVVKESRKAGRHGTPTRAFDSDPDAPVRRGVGSVASVKPP